MFIRPIINERLSLFGACFEEKKIVYEREKAKDESGGRKKQKNRREKWIDIRSKYGRTTMRNRSFLCAYLRFVSQLYANLRHFF